VKRAQTVPLRKTTGTLERGRAAYRSRAWADAQGFLSAADRSLPLAAADLELLAIASVLTGSDKDFLSALERAYHAYLEDGDPVGAARTAFWSGFRLQYLGQRGAASGWMQRAKRLIENETGACVEKGYLLLPAIFMALHSGDADAAYTAAAHAIAIGEKFSDADLTTFARNLQARALMLQARVREGLQLLDETMVTATAQELSPIMTGLIYCSAIETYHRVYALGRAREWTTSLHEWCEEQTQLVTFSGRCLVHRAEILQINGDWPAAIEEARRAHKKDALGGDREVVAAAFYQEGEVYRLRGAFQDAETAYAQASELGLEPLPGLALLRLAQGRKDTSAAAIRRVLAATTERLQRTRYLPAYVEIMLANGEIEDARRASDELRTLAGTFESRVLGAMAAHAQGAVALAEGKAETALAPLRHAFEIWRQTEAPYIAARLRVLIGLACHALKDEDNAALEWNSARSVFKELGAAPDLARLDSLHEAAPSHGLTKRELQVLSLVAAGKTNKRIAHELGLSEKTVDRHVSNIFVKLNVSSRAAATADAYKRKLI
jgi:DNA-binding CsgD family transcriptional regulator